MSDQPPPIEQSPLERHVTAWRRAIDRAVQILDEQAPPPPHDHED